MICKLQIKIKQPKSVFLLGNYEWAKVAEEVWRDNMQFSTEEKEQYDSMVKY